MKHFIFQVDRYRRPSRQRNTAGAYVVYAKNKKTARQILQEKIKFGSILYAGYFEENNEWTSEHPKDKGIIEVRSMKRNECFKLKVEVLNGRAHTSLLPVVAETDCQKDQDALSKP